jgi:hypothetical protein
MAAKSAAQDAKATATSSFAAKILMHFELLFKLQAFPSTMNILIPLA